MDLTPVTRDIFSKLRGGPYLSSTASNAVGPANMAEMKLPERFARIPREILTVGSSPIQHLPRMSADLPGSCQIYAKREDLNSGLAYGGNKVRKLEYLIPDALAQKCDTLVSVGGIQSNHTRQVTAVAAKCGIRTIIISSHWADWECQGYEEVGNIQLTRLMGAETVMAPEGFSAAQCTEDHEIVKEIFDRVKCQGGAPYWIPAGASDHPLGGLGFARWAFEVAQQEEQMGLFFDTVVVCAVTGSTFGGILAGFKLFEQQGGRTRKIIGVNASAKADETFQQVLKIAKATADKIGLPSKFIQGPDIVLERDYCGPAYGVPDRQTVEAIKYGATMDAFITDLVYEGKTLAGLIDMIMEGEISGGNVLFAQLGGQLALNAYTNMEEQLR